MTANLLVNLVNQDVLPDIPAVPDGRIFKLTTWVYGKPIVCEPAMSAG